MSGEKLEIEYTTDENGPVLVMQMPDEASKRAVITDELCGPFQMKLIACADISGDLWYKFQHRAQKGD